MSQHKPIEEHKFLKGLDIVEKTMKLAPAPVKVNPHPLVGTWLNADKSTRSIVKLIFTESAGDLFVETFGACVPTPCLWGKIKATAFSGGVCNVDASSFTAHYDHGFAEETLNGTFFEGALVVDIFTIFKDHSGRENYHVQDTLYRP